MFIFLECDQDKSSSVFFIFVSVWYNDMFCEFKVWVVFLRSGDFKLLVIYESVNNGLLDSWDGCERVALLIGKEPVGGKLLHYEPLHAVKVGTSVVEIGTATNDDRTNLGGCRDFIILLFVILKRRNFQIT